MHNMAKLFFYLFLMGFKPFFIFLPGPLAFVLIGKLSLFLYFILIISPLKKVISNNLDLIYGAGNGQKMVRPYLKKMSRYVFEILNLGELKSNWLNKIIYFEESQRLDKVLAQGQGALLLCMHCGNWELLARALALKGYPLTAVVNSPTNDFFIQFMDKTRIKNKVKLINIKEENMFRALLKAFKNNELVLLAADTGATDSDKNIDLDFLGRKLPIASGWAALVLKSKTPVIPLTIISGQQKPLHRAKAHKIIYPANFTEEKALLQEALEIFAAHIKAHPDEWLLPLSESETKKTFG